MKRMTTAGFAAAALLGATFAGSAWAQQADADVELQVPRSADVEADAKVDSQRDRDADRNDRDAVRNDRDANRNDRGVRSDVEGQARARARGQFVQRADGKLQVRDDQGQVLSHRLADDAVIVLDGREVQWSEVRQGDQLRFQTGPNEMVTRVTVVRDSNVAQAGQFREGQAPQAGQQDGVFLGVHITESPTTGVYVRDVMPGGPAAQGGIQARDYILTVNGEKVASPEEFDRKMAELEVGNQAKFEVWRNQQKQPVTLQLTQTREQFAQSQGQRPQGQSQPGQFAQTQPGQLQQDRSAAFRPEDQQQDRNRTEGKAWLGVQLQESAPAAEGQAREQGVRITNVYPSGPAARYGLRDGDMIVRVADQQVTSSEEAAQLIARQKIGEAVPVVVRRGDEEVTMEVVLADRSDFFFDQDQFQQDQFQQNQFQGQQPDQARFGGDFHSSDIPEHAMILEQHRRFAEQNEQTHRMLYELQEEVQKLHRDLNSRNGNNDQNR